MTQITVNNGFSFSHAQLDLSGLFTTDLAEHSATAILLTTGSTNQLRLGGTGFTYDAANHPTDGVVTGLEGLRNGQLAFTLTGADLDLGDLRTVEQSALKSAARLQLLAGDDQLLGADGFDYFFGSTGHDVIMGGGASDTIDGGDGNDHIYGQSPNGGPDGDDTIYGGAGNDYINGNAGDDYILDSSGSDRIFGGAGDDAIYAFDGNDTVNGNLGNDSIYGGAGNDSLRGGQGDDEIFGEAGRDILIGDLGNDKLSGSAGSVFTGGGGADVFSYGGGGITGRIDDASLLSVVTDFTNGEDHFSIGFTPLAVLTGTASSLQEAYDVAQLLMIANETVKEVVAVQVGADTYLIHSLSGLRDLPEVAAIVQNTQASLIDVGDF